MLFRSKKGEIVYSPASNCLGLVMVLGGVLRAYLVSEEGRKATIFRMRREEVCVLTMSCILTALTFDVEIEAEEDSEVLIIPANCFAAINENNIYVENYGYKLATEKYSEMMQAVQQILFMSLEERIGAFLIDELSATGSVRIHITKEALAENIGSAREAVSRSLKKMSEKGMIRVGRGCIEILDKKALYENAGD